MKESAHSDRGSLHEEYSTFGACLVKGALSPDEVEIVRNAVDSWISQAPDGAEGVQPFHASDGTQVVKYDGGYYAEALSRTCPSIRKMLRGSAVPRIACRALGAESITFWRDEAHYKTPSMLTNATPWHHDIAGIPFKGRDIVTVWISLAPIGESVGPLRTVSKSHLDMAKRYRPPSRTVAPDDDGSLYLNMPDFDALIAAGELEAKTWTMATGDGLIFDSHTVHCSLPNTSQTARIAYATRWIGADARYAPDVYSVTDPAIDVELLSDGRPSGPEFSVFNFPTS